MSNLDLIDWSLVGFSALWIVGLGLLLAALSHASYTAARRRIRLGAVLKQPGPQVAVNVGLVLFCLGLAGTSEAIWERLVWLGLALVFAFQAWQAWRSSRLQPGTPQA